MLGSIPTSEMADFTTNSEKLPLVYVETIYQSQTTTYLLVLFHKDVKEKVTTLLKKAAFEQYIYPYEGIPEEDLQTMKEKSQRLIDEEKEIKAALRAMTNEQEMLRIVAEYLDGAITRLKSNKMLLRSTHAVSISGWVPVDGATELEKRIKKRNHR